MSHISTCTHNRENSGIETKVCLLVLEFSQTFTSPCGSFSCGCVHTSGFKLVHQMLNKIRSFFGACSTHAWVRDTDQALQVATSGPGRIVDIFAETIAGSQDGGHWPCVCRMGISTWVESSRTLFSINMSGCPRTVASTVSSVPCKEDHARAGLDRALRTVCVFF